MNLVRLSLPRETEKSSGAGRYSNLDCDEERRGSPPPGHSLPDMAGEAFEVADDSGAAFDEFAALAHQEPSIRIQGVPVGHVQHRMQVSGRQRLPVRRLSLA